MANACKEYGLKLGIYLSPWDRNHPDYGKPEYITYFRNQLTELLTSYGPIFEIWFDGANGGTGYYGGANENRKIDRTTYYDWPDTYKLIVAAPAIIRDQSGEVNMTPVDAESVVYYTLNGSIPSPKSKKYNGPFQTHGKLEIKAIAFDKTSGKSSPVAYEKFDIPRKDWKIVGLEDEKAYVIIDGNSATSWHQAGDKKMPVDLVIDLGRKENVCGFRYLPDTDMWNPGIITHYQFYVSADNIEWKLVDQGEFSNIKNNPLWQTKRFATKKIRYIKFRALNNTQGNDNTGYAEVDIITN